MDFLNIITFLIILIAVFVIRIIIFHDFKTKSLNIKNYLSANSIENILIIYPHPDDELMNSGGLIYKLNRNNSVNTFVVSTTHGEHGDELLKISPNELGKLRAKEYSNVMKILGAKKYEIWNFEDGNSASEELRMKEKIRQFITDNDIDLVVTYEKFGLYGHPDHMILAKVVNDLKEEMGFRVLFSTLPDKILKQISLPKTITLKGKVVPLTLDKIADPEYRFNTFGAFFVRYAAVKQYKSQNLKSGKIPMWLTELVMGYEYYTEKY